MNAVSPITPNIIEIAELEGLVSERAATLFEVLPRPYWTSGHIPGAKNLPLEELERTVVAEVPARDAAIVVYCSGPTCRNSHQAAERLVRLGYRNVRVFVGGKSAWKDAGLALEVAS